MKKFLLVLALFLTGAVPPPSLSKADLFIWGFAKEVAINTCRNLNRPSLIPVPSGAVVADSVQAYAHQYNIQSMATQTKYEVLNVLRPEYIKALGDYKWDIWVPLRVYTYNPRKQKREESRKYLRVGMMFDGVATLVVTSTKIQ